MIERGATEPRPRANFFLNFLYRIRTGALTLKYRQCTGWRDRGPLHPHREAASYKTARLRRSPSTLQ
jgi:hypothetical protein